MSSKKWRKVRPILAMVMTLLLSVARGVAAAEPDHLEIAPGILESSRMELVHLGLVRGVLVGAEARNHFARAIVIPSFEPEWMVRIVESRTPRGFCVEHKGASRSILDAVQDIASEDLQSLIALKGRATLAPLDEGVALRFRAMLDRMLKETRYPPSRLWGGEDVIRLDGTAYHFSNGWHAGETTSPISGATAALVATTEALRGLALASPDSQSGRMQDVHRALAKLREELGIPEESLVDWASELDRRERPTRTERAIEGHWQVPAADLAFSCDWEGDDRGFFPRYSVCLESLDRYLSEDLEELSEEPLHDREAASGEVYRFVRGADLEGPISIRVELAAKSTLYLKKMEIETAALGKLVRADLTRELDGEEVERLTALLREVDFWKLPRSIGATVGLEGGIWIIEGVADGRYKAVQSWAPVDGPVRRLGDLLLELAGIGCL